MLARRRLLVFALAGALATAFAGAAQSASAAPSAPQTPTLVGIRTAHHPGFDRVVFDFAGGLPGSRQVGYVSSLAQDPSGLPARIPGRAILRVRFFSANAHNAAGASTAPSRVAYTMPNVMTAVRTGDFEAVTTYGLGLAKRVPFTVFTLHNPNRVVIDVNAGFATVSKKVYFFNQNRFVANTPPFFVPVNRPVQPLTPATGVMDRLYAGPTPTEQANGLRLLLSHSTGFTNLQIGGQIARVQLTGKQLSSNGSTVTVARQIFPTLKQFSTVDWVKIYDYQGNTEHPYGPIDSIPEVLEP
jgi:hypothetical protein